MKNLFQSKCIIQIFLPVLQYAMDVWLVTVKMKGFVLRPRTTNASSNQSVGMYIVHLLMYFCIVLQNKERYKGSNYWLIVHFIKSFDFIENFFITWTNRTFIEGTQTEEVQPVRDEIHRPSWYSHLTLFKWVLKLPKIPLAPRVGVDLDFTIMAYDSFSSFIQWIFNFMHLFSFFQM